MFENLDAIIISAFVLLLIWYTIRWYKKTIYLFYMPSCNYCKEFMPEWRRIEQSATLTQYPRLNPIKVNINASGAISGNHSRYLADKYGVETVPHIVKLTSRGYEVYEGDRKADKIINWCYQ